NAIAVGSAYLAYDFRAGSFVSIRTTVAAAPSAATERRLPSVGGDAAIGGILSEGWVVISPIVRASAKGGAWVSARSSSNRIVPLFPQQENPSGVEVVGDGGTTAHVSTASQQQLLDRNAKWSIGVEGRSVVRASEGSGNEVIVEIWELPDWKPTVCHLPSRAQTLTGERLKNRLASVAAQFEPMGPITRDHYSRTLSRAAGRALTLPRVLFLYAGGRSTFIGLQDREARGAARLLRLDVRTCEATSVPGDAGEFVGADERMLLFASNQGDSTKIRVVRLRD
ncbi:MAG: hypothetical protein ABMA00_06190, partial [Gemmatimonas sp.]